MATVLSAVSFSLAGGVAVFLLVTPIYTDGSSRGMTFLELNGAEETLVIFIPMFIALLALLIRKRFIRIASAFLLTGWVAIGAASVGLLYIPAAIAMFAAAYAPDETNAMPARQ